MNEITVKDLPQIPKQSHLYSKLKKAKNRWIVETLVKNIDQLGPAEFNWVYKSTLILKNLGETTTKSLLEKRTLFEILKDNKLEVHEFNHEKAVLEVVRRSQKSIDEMKLNLEAERARANELAADLEKSKVLINNLLDNMGQAH